MDTSTYLNSPIQTTPVDHTQRSDLVEPASIDDIAAGAPQHASFGAPPDLNHTQHHKRCQLRRRASWLLTQTDSHLAVNDTDPLSLAPDSLSTQPELQQLASTDDVDMMDEAGAAPQQDLNNDSTMMHDVSQITAPTTLTRQQKSTSKWKKWKQHLARKKNKIRDSYSFFSL